VGPYRSFLTPSIIYDDISFVPVWFMLTVTFLCAFTTFLCARPPQLLSEWFELVPATDDNPQQATFRVLLLLFPVANLLLSFLIEVRD